MTQNQELATRFEELAALMEIVGANTFRVSAIRKVARILEDLDVDITTIAHDTKELKAIDGIGDGSATKIQQWCERGSFDDLDQLREDVPEGLIDLLSISGLGPKTVGRLWREADVTDRATLKAAIDDGRLANLPRMGAKTIANINEALEFAQQHADRTPLGVAMPLAESLVEQLLQVKGVSSIQYAGSLRRGCETIGDIDLLAVTEHPEALVAAFTDEAHTLKVLARGDTKASIRHALGVQVDLRIVEADAVGGALLYFTGSKEHNVLLRERARSRTTRLNEYGLFPDDGDDTPPQQRGIAPIAAATEDEIYTALELPFHPPELREARDDITNEPADDLIVRADIGSDLHTHTTASDGVLSIEELVDEARRRGYHTLAITDHSPSQPQANGLSIDRLLKHIKAIAQVAANHQDICVLAGTEVDILSDGRLDYPDDVLSQLDLVVASPHAALRQDSNAATERLVRAASHPLVHIIGHPTGRMIGRRPGLEPNMKVVAEAAADHRTALEINANPRRLDLGDKHVRIAIESGAMIAINTDAHTAEHFDFLRYGILTGRRGGLTAPRCINTWANDTLMDWLKTSV
ncbi:MAG: DNA polymerase/3'-5' exonuclease PolX [Phycisphaerales bacterium]|nr:DNA polymerase/3'-5' exonuclease PolX [Phycisphaerales bacterium]